jgi:hypothetical protein
LGSDYSLDVNDSYFRYRSKASAENAFEFWCWDNQPLPE